MKKILFSLLSVFTAIVSYADFTGDYDVSNWALTLTNSDGSVSTAGAPAFITITSGNNGGGNSGNTDYTITVPNDTTITFSWSYTTSDGAAWDYPLELINGTATIFPNFDTGGPGDQEGVLSLRVVAGDAFGFRMHTVDNIFGRATLTISDFELTPTPPEIVNPISDINIYIGSAEQTLSLFEVFEDANDADTDLIYSVVGNSDPSIVTPSTISSADGLLDLNFGNAGTSLVTIKVENLSGGFVTEVFMVEVEKYPLTVRADAKTRAYGSANPTLTISYEGFIDGDDESVLDVIPSTYTSASLLSPAGNYTISLYGGSDDKYQYYFVYSTLTVTPAPLSVTAGSYSRYYGETNPTLTFSYSGFVNGEDSTVLDAEPTISTLADANSDAGNYDITLSGGVDDNYEFIYIEGTLTVLKIELTVTASNQLKTYGDPNPTLNFDYAGFINADDETDIDIPPVITTSATEFSDVGDYDIIVSGGSDNNYTFNYIWGTLNISKADITAQADDQVKAYGEANPVFTISYTGLVNDDDAGDIDTPPAATTVADETSLPGTYAITLTGGMDNNYNMTNSGGTLIISKASLSVVADNMERNYKDPNPELTITYSGFVNGESENDLDEQPVIATTADISSNAGTYPITLAGGNDNNYDLALTDGTLTINPVELEITADDQTKAYGEEVPTLTFNISGFVTGEDESVLTSPVVITTDANAASSAGVYPIMVSGAEAVNYTMVFVDGELTITKISLTAEADNQERPYGEANPAFSVSYEGFINGDDASAIDEDPTGTTTADENSDVGIYEITLAGGNDDNYDFIYVPGILTIVKADQSINFPPLAEVFVGDDPFDPGASAGSGLEISYISSNPSVATITAGGLIQIEAAGTVTITASQEGNDNYNAANPVDQTLTVNEAPDATLSIPITAIKLYPNPSPGEVNIGSSKPGERIAVRVYDLSGNIVVSDDNELTPYRLFFEKPGVYVIQIEYLDLITTQKLIIR